MTDMNKNQKTFVVPTSLSTFDLKAVEKICVSKWSSYFNSNTKADSSGINLPFDPRLKRNGATINCVDFKRVKFTFDRSVNETDYNKKLDQVSKSGPFPDSQLPASLEISRLTDPRKLSNRVISTSLKSLQNKSNLSPSTASQANQLVPRQYNQSISHVSSNSSSKRTMGKDTLVVPKKIPNQLCDNHSIPFSPNKRNSPNSVKTAESFRKLTDSTTCHNVVSSGPIISSPSVVQKDILIEASANDISAGNNTDMSSMLISSKLVGVKNSHSKKASVDETVKKNDIVNNPAYNSAIRRQSSFLSEILKCKQTSENIKDLKGKSNIKLAENREQIKAAKQYEIVSKNSEPSAIDFRNVPDPKGCRYTPSQLGDQCDEVTYITTSVVGRDQPSKKLLNKRKSTEDEDIYVIGYKLPSAIPRNENCIRRENTANKNILVHKQVSNCSAPTPEKEKSPKPDINGNEVINSENRRCFRQRSKHFAEDSASDASIIKPGSKPKILLSQGKTANSHHGSRFIRDYKKLKFFSERLKLKKSSLKNASNCRNNHIKDLKIRAMGDVQTQNDSIIPAKAAYTLSKQRAKKNCLVNSEKSKMIQDVNEEHKNSQKAINIIDLTDTEEIIDLTGNEEHIKGNLSDLKSTTVKYSNVIGPKYSDNNLSQLLPVLVTCPEVPKNCLNILGEIEIQPKCSSFLPPSNKKNGTRIKKFTKLGLSKKSLYILKIPMKLAARLSYEYSICFACSNTINANRKFPKSSAKTAFQKFVQGPLVQHLIKHSSIRLSNKLVSFSYNLFKQSRSNMLELNQSHKSNLACSKCSVAEVKSFSTELCDNISCDISPKIFDTTHQKTVDETNQFQIFSNQTLELSSVEENPDNLVKSQLHECNSSSPEVHSIQIQEISQSDAESCQDLLGPVEETDVSQITSNEVDSTDFHGRLDKCIAGNPQSETNCAANIEDTLKTDIENTFSDVTDEFCSTSNQTESHSEEIKSSTQVIDDVLPLHLEEELCLENSSKIISKSGDVEVKFNSNCCFKNKKIDSSFQVDDKLFSGVDLFKVDGILYWYYKHLNSIGEHSIQCNRDMQDVSHLSNKLMKSYYFLKDQLNYHKSILRGLVHTTSEPGIDHNMELVHKIACELKYIEGYEMACKAILI